MPATFDLRRGQVVGDASRRAVNLNTLSRAVAAATYAPIASPSFTGDPKAPTPAPGDNDTSIATTAFVTAAPNKTITLSGDIAGSGTAAITTTLPNVNANVGTFQGLTINAKGQVTAAANQSYVTGGPYLALTGGTLTGQLTVAPASGDAVILVEPATATGRAVYQAVVPSVAAWYWGADGTDSGKWKLSAYGPTFPTPVITTTATNVGIGTATPGSMLTVNGSCANVSGAWTTISDAGVKEHVTPYTRGLDAILALNPVRFRYVKGSPFAEEKASPMLFGLIADDVKPHVPEIVGRTKATIGKKEGVELSTLEPGNLIYALINALKELNAKVEALSPAPR